MIDTSKITIRNIKESEVELLTTYRLAYLTELQGERSDEYKHGLKNDLNEYFGKAMYERRFIALLAELDGEILSFGAMVIKHIPGDFNRSTYLEADILNMYTIPSARKQGISAKILEQLLKEAKKMGISKVSLHTTKNGEHLYRKYGFTEPIYPVLELCF